MLKNIKLKQKQKQNKTKQKNETKRNETKRNKTKQNKTKRILSKLHSLYCYSTDMSGPVDVLSSTCISFLCSFKNSLYFLFHLIWVAYKNERMTAIWPIQLPLEQEPRWAVSVLLKFVHCPSFKFGVRINFCPGAFKVNVWMPVNTNGSYTGYANHISYYLTANS